MLETGKTWPQYPTLCAIAGALGVPESTLFAAAPAPPPDWREALKTIARELECTRQTPARDPLAERLAKLGPSDRQYVEDLLKGLEENPTSPEPDQRPPEKRK